MGPGSVAVAFVSFLFNSSTDFNQSLRSAIAPTWEQKLSTVHASSTMGKKLLSETSSAGFMPAQIKGDDTPQVQLGRTPPCSYREKRLPFVLPLYLWPGLSQEGYTASWVQDEGACQCLEGSVVCLPVGRYQKAASTYALPTGPVTAAQRARQSNHFVY